MAKEKSIGRPVLVTTEFRGVFFGYAADTSGDPIVLVNARNCIYWSSDVGGFAGLAANGPSKTCRIGARVGKIELRKITSVAEVEPVAVDAWESANVHKGYGFGYGYGDGDGYGDGGGVTIIEA